MELKIPLETLETNELLEIQANITSILITRVEPLKTKQITPTNKKRGRPKKEPLPKQKPWKVNTKFKPDPLGGL